MKFEVQCVHKLSGETNSLTLEIPQSGCLLGREQADMVIADAKCSRRHAVIKRDEKGTLWIIDLQSRNGITVNGRKVKEARLEAGMRVGIGDTLLTFFPVPSLSPEVVVHQWPDLEKCTAS